MRSFKTRSMTRGLAVLMLGALTSLALACGGGGGGGGGGVIPNTGCAAFTAAAAPAAGTVVLQNTANSTCNLVVVDVVITDVTDVFTASFDMNYNAAHLRYDGFSVTNTLLNSDGNTIQTLENTAVGQVTLGLTRTGMTGIDAVGSQPLVRLTFTRLVNAGNSTLTFGNQDVFGSQAPPQAKAGIAWSGGSVAIN